MLENYKRNQKQLCFYITLANFLNVKFNIRENNYMGNLKLIIIVIILSLLYVLICNGTKYKQKLNLYTKHNYNTQNTNTMVN